MIMVKTPLMGCSLLKLYCFTKLSAGNKKKKCQAILVADSGNVPDDLGEL